MSNPYENLEDNAYWKLAVANRSMYDISGLWQPKFHIKRSDKVATFGSCFAQYIGQSLQQRGFQWLRTETPPHGLAQKHKKKYNYDVFSARTGNIYTTTLLEQWTKWALGHEEIPTEHWSSNDRFIDPFRPRVEPTGFVSAEEAKQSLEQTVASFKECIEKADYFVFTLGLTESWINTNTNVEYPTCPGTVAGEYDESAHKFVNLQFDQILTAMSNAMLMMREVNKKLKFILTVSPVPLTATNSKQHVLVATMASKSILRAVAGQMASNRGYVDYFPSYEIINSPVFKGNFFEPNQRSVCSTGVSFVMDSFFQAQVSSFGEYSDDFRGASIDTASMETICEEELLEAFAK